MAWASSPTTVRARPPSAQGPHDVGLEEIGVLVLVDQHVVVGVGQGRPEGVVGGGRPPVQEQIVEVEQVVLALAPGVAAEDLPPRAPSCSCTQGKDRRSTSSQRLAER